MVLNSIEKLLEKYDNGETSLKEEQKLKDYFAQDDVAPHLESYKMMFQYFNTTKQELYTKDVPLKPKRNNLYKWISVAAVAVLMLGIFIPRDSQINSLAELTPEQLEAYSQTKEALAMLSSNFNEGTSGLNALKFAASSFDKGAEQMNYVGEFGKTTNKILKNK
ncbi:hypothetical protein [Ichthyenterobacterium magnum]|uniref:Uncharacterized protein n=1 Tax=Ichthyenterobacterium magnum TaxID=1230530 RepID=A0A420DLA8_9FLAO|nr:hypothetical protein [Ichthyenterobacterium magnum]RKE94981.1 hypothetical protein BXY80_1998 [Ichthyenterobacterium magnum]